MQSSKLAGSRPSTPTQQYLDINEIKVLSRSCHTIENLFEASFDQDNDYDNIKSEINDITASTIN